MTRCHSGTKRIDSRVNADVVFEQIVQNRFRVKQVGARLAEIRHNDFFLCPNLILQLLWSTRLLNRSVERLIPWP